MSGAKQVVVSGAFDDIRARQLRFLEEASKFGELTVMLWPDELIQAMTGKPPKFPLAERLYFLNAVRYVSRVVPQTNLKSPDAIPLEDFPKTFSRNEPLKPQHAPVLLRSSPRGAGLGEKWPFHFGSWAAGFAPQMWVDQERDYRPERRRFCQERGIEYRVLPASQMNGFPEPCPMPSPPGRKTVIATGCYDWFHSGHVRFTQEASAHGDLYVVVGHDANIRVLKGDGHPLLSQEERRYAVGSIRFVKQALISSGTGWLDAEPEIQRIKPDAYIVNEDGDKGGKREYCAQHGIEYIVLKRAPAPGLPRRSSTDLRGF